MKYILLLLALITTPAAISETLFQNSVVSNDIDFITANDPTVKSVVIFKGISEREMPGNITDRLIDKKAFVYEVEFDDGSSLGVWAHSDFTNQLDAETYIRTLVGPLGRLPSAMRHKLSHIVLQKGNDGAFAEHLGHFFVVYSDNIITRFKNNDLEETLFHESVHATLDSSYRGSSEWSQVQRLDKGFVTEYAATYPVREDLAETSLFVYTLLKHPDRLPEDVSQWLRENIPNRIEFINNIFSDQ